VSHILLRQKRCCVTYDLANHESNSQPWDFNLNQEPMNRSTEQRTQIPEHTVEHDPPYLAVLAIAQPCVGIAPFRLKL
jgi:hypothetical protein